MFEVSHITAQLCGDIYQRLIREETDGYGRCNGLGSAARANGVGKEMGD